MIRYYIPAVAAGGALGGSRCGWPGSLLVRAAAEAGAQVRGGASREVGGRSSGEGGHAMVCDSLLPGAAAEAGAQVSVFAGAGASVSGHAVWGRRGTRTESRWGSVGGLGSSPSVASGTGGW